MAFRRQTKTTMLTDEELADHVQDVGVNWEHVVASNDNVRIPERPLKITDVLMQENIDPLDMITEAFVRELNPRSIDEKTGDKQRKQAATRIKDPRNPEESLYSLFGVIRITRFSCVWVVLMENHSLFHVVGHIRSWKGSDYSMVSDGF